MDGPLSKLRSMFGPEAEGVMGEAMAGGDFLSEIGVESDADLEAAWDGYETDTAAAEIAVEGADAETEHAPTEPRFLHELSTDEQAAHAALIEDQYQQHEANEREAERDTHENDQDEYDAFIAKEAEYFENQAAAGAYPDQHHADLPAPRLADPAYLAAETWGADTAPFADTTAEMEGRSDGI